MQQEKLEVWEEPDLLLLAGSGDGGGFHMESMRRNVGHLQGQTLAPTDRQQGNKDQHPTTVNTEFDCQCDYVWKQMLPQRLQLGTWPSHHPGILFFLFFAFIYIYIFIYLYSVRFSSVTRHVWLFETPWIAAHQDSLSINNSRSWLKLMSIELEMPFSHLILLSPSPPAPYPSKHQGLFQWVNSSHQEAKVLEFQLQYQSFQWTPRTDLL